ncbi:hypothetical protein Nepgr_003488 [Nepenthes gracilis]|uniref:Uncharacterized protein n=1 Tax=Nepenthes gracilis TaxID=150966 RepID=A0AAD3XDN4_NEPGR|nr:hypothetical protein Nepgr_003488 [Nepenthes gracilis]
MPARKSKPEKLDEDAKQLRQDPYEVENHCAHIYSVTITEEEARDGLVCRVQSSEKSKFVCVKWQNFVLGLWETVTVYISSPSNFYSNVMEFLSLPPLFFICFGRVFS